MSAGQFSAGGLCDPRGSTRETRKDHVHGRSSVLYASEASCTVPAGPQVHPGAGEQIAPAREADRGRHREHARACDEEPASAGEVEGRSEEHTSELQSPCNLVCRLLLEKKKKRTTIK